MTSIELRAAAKSHDGDMKIDAELVADHALGIAHVLGRVEPEGGRKRVQDRPPGLAFAAAAASSTRWRSCSATVLPLQRSVRR